MQLKISLPSVSHRVRAAYAPVRDGAATFQRMLVGQFVGFLVSALLGLTFGAASPAFAEDFLPPEQAFMTDAKILSDGNVELNWRIAPGYYLYRERLQLHTGAATPGAPLVTPSADTKFDKNFNRTMEIYHQQLKLALTAAQWDKAEAVVMQYQGCAEKGLCYPPQFVQLAVTRKGDALTGVQLAAADGPPSAAAPVAAITPGAATPAATSATKSAASAAPQDMIGATLMQGNWLQTATVFWLAGLLLAFTPCVLPMVPILSTLIVGQSGEVTRKKGFTLALAYVLGMALVYAALGMAAGLAGEGLAASLQKPAVLASFALVLSVLSLGMFGVFELQMPAFIQNSAIGWSNRVKGGSYIGVFLMGGLSALILGPCVAAPLAGALVFISQTGNVALGGLALFFMALGMGVPLLLVGMSAGSLLPRTGAWMELVKHVFGMVLLGTALWIVSPVLSVPVQMLGWSALFLGLAFALGGIYAAKQPRLVQLVGIGSLGLAAVLLVGAASGGNSLLQPLIHLKAASAGAGGFTASTEAAHALPFTRVSSVAELDAALAQAATQKKVTMLDFYADWCVACKEFESYTFSDPAVRERIAKGQVQLLQADVTRNNAQDKTLLKRFTLFGPPAIVFMQGEPAQVNHQVVGYQDAKEFGGSLTRAGVN